MSTTSLATVLPTLFRELVQGSADPGARTYVLNQGDRGLLASLDRLSAAAGTHRDVSEVEAGWMAGSVAHLAYHMGAIRQIDRATRGPGAEDEARRRR